jgi:citrate synthase
MVKWWLPNPQPLTEPEARLVAALYKAHSECVFRPNCSTTALQQAAGGSRSLHQSIIAALACLGEMHGPIEEAYKFLEREGPWEGAFVFGKISGWGNSFVKGQIDHAFLPVDQCLEANFPRTHARLREITEALHARGKHVFPNPAAYTAATALVLQMPRHLAPMLFVQARVEAWSSVFHHTVMSLENPVKKEEAA